MKQITLVKNTFLALLVALMLFSCSSCATQKPFLISSVVPAARGTIQVKQDKNSNYVINIQLSNLAEPERLQPPKKTYVVWMVTANNTTRNIGQIKPSNGALKASFQTISSSKPTKVFITAEDDATIQFWSSPIVLTTEEL